MSDSGMSVAFSAQRQCGWGGDCGLNRVACVLSKDAVVCATHAESQTNIVMQLRKHLTIQCEACSDTLESS